MTLLRPGKITIDELACVGQVTIADAVTNELGEGQIALSPGMKYRHYAPSAQLILLDGETDDIIDFLNENIEENIAVISYSDDSETIISHFPNVDIFSLGSKENINQQAHLLFSVLRETDKHSYTKIYAPLPSKEGVGLALYNRMIRAAAHTIINLRQGRNG